MNSLLCFALFFWSWTCSNSVITRKNQWMQTNSKRIDRCKGKGKIGKQSVSVISLNILEGKVHKRTQKSFLGVNMLTYT